MWFTGVVRQPLKGFLTSVETLLLLPLTVLLAYGVTLGLRMLMVKRLSDEWSVQRLLYVPVPLTGIGGQIAYSVVLPLSPAAFIYLLIGRGVLYIKRLMPLSRTGGGRRRRRIKAVRGAAPVCGPVQGAAPFIDSPKEKQTDGLLFLCI